MNGSSRDEFRGDLHLHAVILCLPMKKKDERRVGDFRTFQENDTRRLPVQLASKVASRHGSQVRYMLDKVLFVHLIDA